EALWCATSAARSSKCMSRTLTHSATPPSCRNNLPVFKKFIHKSRRSKKVAPVRPPRIGFTHSAALVSPIKIYARNQRPRRSLTKAFAGAATRVWLVVMVKDSGKGALRAGAAETRRRTRPSLARAIKQARKVGVTVSGATIAADGSVSLTFGEPTPAQQNDLDRWMAKRHAN